jgi:hypothetical protein
MTRLTPNAKAFAVHGIEDWLLCTFGDECRSHKVTFWIFDLSLILAEIGLPIVNLIYIQSLAHLTASPKVSLLDKRLRLWEE